MQAQPLQLPGQHEYHGQPFPLALKVNATSLEDACAWAREHAAELDAQAASHGAVLLRGMPLASPEDFDAIVAAIGFPVFSYADSLSNAYRINYTPRVFSANEAPPEVTIFLHHEMAQTPSPPAKLFFFCQTAPVKRVSNEIKVQTSFFCVDQILKAHPFAKDELKKNRN